MDNYEQKYKDALEKLQEALAPTEDGCKISGLTRGCIENIFPELKESEDEKIRKDILCYFEHYAHDIKGADVQKWLDWLEKQGEKMNPYSGMSFEYNGHIWGMCARDNGVEILFDGELKAFLSLEKSFIYPIYPKTDLAHKSALKAIKEEKVDNQNCIKPSENDEPKFHPGDWVILNGTVAQILDKQKYGFVGIDINGEDFFYNYGHTDSMRLWTIADAKDGDVLSGEIDGEVFVFLFNQIQDRWIVAHVYYSETDGEFIEKAYLHKYHLFSPATKEQRDLLFQKMKEVGYEWDSKKKNETTTWSEEDEKIALSIEQVINCASLLNIVPDKIEKIRTWLKTLKQRT